MRFSIIIPMFNSEKFVISTLRSVIQQTYGKFEVIVVNDGSTDNSFEVVQKFIKEDNRFQVFNKVNGGVSSARNYGLRKAKNEMIIFLDSDDILDTLALEIINTKIKNNVDFIIYQMIEFDTESNLVNLQKSSKREDFKEEFIPNNKVFEEITCNPSIGGFIGNKVYKRSIIAENNISFDSSISMSEDLLFNIEYSKFCKKTCYIEEQLLYYRQHACSNSKQFSLRNLESISNVYEQLKKDTRIRSKKVIRKIENNEFNYLFHYYLNSNDEEIKNKTSKLLASYPLFKLTNLKIFFKKIYFRIAERKST